MVPKTTSKKNYFTARDQLDLLLCIDQKQSTVTPNDAIDKARKSWPHNRSEYFNPMLGHQQLTFGGNG